MEKEIKQLAKEEVQKGIATLTEANPGKSIQEIFDSLSYREKRRFYTSCTWSAIHKSEERGIRFLSMSPYMKAVWDEVRTILQDAEVVA